MSTAIPQSHLYIFTEEQRNFNFSDEALTEDMTYFFESIRSIIDENLKMEVKPLTFMDVLKGFGMLLLVLTFLIFMVCCITIGLFIGLIIKACTTTFDFIGKNIKKLFQKA